MLLLPALMLLHAPTLPRLASRETRTDDSQESTSPTRGSGGGGGPEAAFRFLPPDLTAGVLVGMVTGMIAAGGADTGSPHSAGMGRSFPLMLMCDACWNACWNDGCWNMCMICVNHFFICYTRLGDPGQTPDHPNTITHMPEFHEILADIISGGSPFMMSLCFSAIKMGSSHDSTWSAAFIEDSARRAAADTGRSLGPSITTEEGKAGGPLVRFTVVGGPMDRPMPFKVDVLKQSVFVSAGF